MQIKSFVITIALFISSINLKAQLTDADGHLYKTVKIGTQEWITTNLDVSHFKNGDPVPEAKTEQEWFDAGNAKKAAWCYYNNDPVNEKKYGKLYNWFAITDPRGLVPEGWHVPAKNEWDILVKYLGGEDLAGNKMKSGKGWVIELGTNTSGFAALPGGLREFLGSSFKDEHLYGYWWSCEQIFGNKGYNISLASVTDYNLVTGTESTEYGYSARCLKGNGPVIVKEKEYELKDKAADDDSDNVAVISKNVMTRLFVPVAVHKK